MSMLPRLKPKEFYDLVIEVAIVRPGPIQGNMVHPYLQRRQESETVSYPSPSPEFGPPDELKQVLSKTLGVPLFQEQAMRIAIVAAGFAPGEADRFRRAMATFKRIGTIDRFEQKFIDGMTRRGYERSSPKRCFSRSRASANTAFRKAMRRASPIWFMPRPGSNAIIRMSSPRRCSTASPWASMRRRRSCATRRSMASRCGRSISMRRTGIARWSPAPTRRRGCMHVTPT